MKFWSWFSSRGFGFVRQRSKRLLKRYQLLPNKAIDRIRTCVEVLGEQGCYPTFPTPGIIVHRYPDFIRELQASGAEIAVHGYQHLDLKAYTIPEAKAQLMKAADMFTKQGIEYHGFRCPYLGFNEGLFNALPKGLFEYSSNSSFEWNICNAIQDNLMFNTIEGLYQAKPAEEKVLIPWMRQNLLEIPIIVPDDIQMLDGLGLSQAEISQVWVKILQTTYQHGELFNLIFHPELADIVLQPFIELLQKAHTFSPSIWIARLFEISQWWYEKEKFDYNCSIEGQCLSIDFSCTPRATILAKNLRTEMPLEDWNAAYKRFLGPRLEIDRSIRPFIGLSNEIPKEMEGFLRNQGYLLDKTELARNCSIYLDKNQVDRCANQAKLVQFIEEQPVPLVRYWRWPNGMQSALSITGDLDALSLRDYSSRIFIT